MTRCISTVDDLIHCQYNMNVRWSDVKFNLTSSFIHAAKHADDSTKAMWKIQFELISLIFKKIGQPFGFIRHIGPTYTDISLIVISNCIVFEFHQDYFLRASYETIEVLPQEECCNWLHISYSNPSLVDLVSDYIIDLEKYYRYINKKHVKRVTFDEFKSSIST